MSGPLWVSSPLLADDQGVGMKIMVAQISEDEGLTVRHAYREGDLNLIGEGERLLGPCDLNLRATRKGDKVRLAGSLNAVIGFECDRCLKLQSLPVAPSFDLSYVPPLKAGDERELGDDDLSIGFYQGETIDLDDLAREQIELALPMARLCNEECKGLCPDCGVNLNDRECDCALKRVDDRWDALRELKPKLN